MDYDPPIPEYEGEVWDGGKCKTGTEHAIKALKHSCAAGYVLYTNVKVLAGVSADVAGNVVYWARWMMNERMLEQLRMAALTPGGRALIDLENLTSNEKLLLAQQESGAGGELHTNEAFIDLQFCNPKDCRG